MFLKDFMWLITDLDDMLVRRRIKGNLLNMSATRRYVSPSQWNKSVTKDVTVYREAGELLSAVMVHVPGMPGTF